MRILTVLVVSLSSSSKSFGNANRMPFYVKIHSYFFSSVACLNETSHGIGNNNTWVSSLSDLVNFSRFLRSSQACWSRMKRSPVAVLLSVQMMKLRLNCPMTFSFLNSRFLKVSRIRRFGSSLMYLS